MLVAYLVRLFPKVEILQTLDLKGLTDVSLDLNLGSLSQLKFTVSTMNTQWNIFKEEFNLGICLSYEDVNLIFAKGRDPQAGSQFGVYNYTFFDFPYLMAYGERKKAYKPFKGSAYEYISDIYEPISFDLVSPDRDIVIEGGRSDNFALLEELCKKAGGWTWRQGSAKREGDFLKPRVEIGTFSDKPAELFADIRQQAFLSDSTKSTVLLNSIKENYAGITPSYLFAYGNAGEGSNSNSIVKFTETQYDFVDSEYPLIEINNQIYIKNNTSTELNIFEDKETKFSANGYFENQAITDLNDARKTVYREGVSYLKTKKDRINYSFDIQIARLVLPGIKVRINYFDEQETLFGNKVIYDVNTDYFLKQITYKTEDLLNLL
jgi:hypothetical protein